MQKLFVTAALAGALGLAACATNAPQSAQAAKAGMVSSQGVEQEETRTGSRLEKRPARSQPVKGITAPDWKHDSTEKPQPMPAGN